MTNAQIIFQESCKLMRDGIIKGTGIMVPIETGDGTTTQMELPEPIHTYAAWKEAGRQVRKGEKARASFTIWKHAGPRTVKDKDTGEETEKGARMFMKLSHFFTYDQTEEISTKAGARR